MYLLPTFDRTNIKKKILLVFSFYRCILKWKLLNIISYTNNMYNVNVNVHKYFNYYLYYYFLINGIFIM